MVTAAPMASAAAVVRVISLRFMFLVSGCLLRTSDDARYAGMTGRRGLRLQKTFAAKMGVAALRNLVTTTRLPLSYRTVWRDCGADG